MLEAAGAGKKAPVGEGSRVRVSERGQERSGIGAMAGMASAAWRLS